MLWSSLHIRAALIIACCVLLYPTCVDAKVYTQCGLVDELRRMNVQRTFIGNWICLIRSESFLNTSAIVDNGRNSKKLGLFQLNSSEYCKFKKPGGKCNMTCEAFLDENIENDYACANYIFENKGWQDWSGWVRSCKQRPSATTMPLC